MYHLKLLTAVQPEDRRTRLRELLAKLNIPDLIVPTSSKRRAEEKEELEAYLTEGVPELRVARQHIAEYSIMKAKQRILGAKRKRETMVPDGDTRANFSNFSNTSSEIGDERPLTAICFAPSSKLLATGSWSGLCKLWDADTCKHRATLRGHRDRIHAISFHPQADISLPRHLASFATCSSDCTVSLWPIAPEDSKEDNFTHLVSLKGHTERVNCVGFHPTGNYLASGSSDKTWRLWDVQTNTELLVQEGHSRAIHGLAFQGDGSLVVTGGEDTIIRAWDLRSGKTIALFQGHVKQIVDMDFSPNGYQFASGSDDHTVRIWDLRTKVVANVLPVHTSLVSTVRYQAQGDYLLSASFDKTCKILNTTNWAPAKVLAGHEGRIMAADISPDNKYIASACYDRTWKMWCDEHALNNTSNGTSNGLDPDIVVKMET